MTVHLVDIVEASKINIELLKVKESYNVAAQTLLLQVDGILSENYVDVSF